MVGDTLELMKTDGSTHVFTVEALTTQEGESVVEAPHPKQKLWIKLPVKALENELLRKVDRKIEKKINCSKRVSDIIEKEKQFKERVIKRESV